MKRVDTGHAEGTLNLLTGRYKSYDKVDAHGLVPLLEPSQPTLFEYLRRSFDIPSHQALLVNGEHIVAAQVDRDGTAPAPPRPARLDCP